MDSLNCTPPTMPLGWARLFGFATVFALITATSLGRAQSSLTKPIAPREVRVGADPLPTAGGTNVPAQALTLIVLDNATGRPIAGAEVSAPIVN